MLTQIFDFALSRSPGLADRSKLYRWALRTRAFGSASSGLSRTVRASDGCSSDAASPVGRLSGMLDNTGLGYPKRTTYAVEIWSDDIFAGMHPNDPSSQPPPPPSSSAVAPVRKAMTKKPAAAMATVPKPGRGYDPSMPFASELQPVMERLGPYLGRALPCRGHKDLLAFCSPLDSSSAPNCPCAGSGVITWRNATWLLINLGIPNSKYSNEFLEGGRKVTWFPGPSGYPPAHPLMRATQPGGLPDGESLHLFCRRGKSGAYVYLGRLGKCDDVEWPASFGAV